MSLELKSLARKRSEGRWWRRLLLR